MGNRLKVAVAGANGYAGMTLVHLLARHPGVELTQLTSRSFAGQPYSAVFPLLDIAGTFQPELEQKGVEFTRPISSERFGLMTAFAIPGGGELALYEPNHPSPLAPGI